MKTKCNCQIKAEKVLGKSSFWAILQNNSLFGQICWHSTEQNCLRFFMLRSGKYIVAKIVFYRSEWSIQNYWMKLIFYEKFTNVTKNRAENGWSVLNTKENWPETISEEKFKKPLPKLGPEFNLNFLIYCKFGSLKQRFFFITLDLSVEVPSTYFHWDNAQFLGLYLESILLWQ